MELIITKKVDEKECRPLEREVPLAIIKTAARKALAGIGESIKSAIPISSTKLIKNYLTTPGGAARAIFLLQVGKDQVVLVVLRLKNDKRIGANMTVQNPKFKKVLEQNLDSILSDLEQGKFTKYSL